MYKVCLVFLALDHGFFQQQTSSCDSEVPLHPYIFVFVFASGMNEVLGRSALCSGMLSGELPADSKHGSSHLQVGDWWSSCCGWSAGQGTLMKSFRASTLVE